MGRLEGVWSGGGARASQQKALWCQRPFLLGPSGGGRGAAVTGAKFEAM